jgi:hypothetical protein
MGLTLKERQDIEIKKLNHIFARNKLKTQQYNLVVNPCFIENY